MWYNLKHHEFIIKEKQHTTRSKISSSHYEIIFSYNQVILSCNHLCTDTKLYEYKNVQNTQMYKKQIYLLTNVKKYTNMKIDCIYRPQPPVFPSETVPIPLLVPPPEQI